MDESLPTPQSVRAFLREHKSTLLTLIETLGDALMVEQVWPALREPKDMNSLPLSPTITLTVRYAALRAFAAADPQKGTEDIRGWHGVEDVMVSRLRAAGFTVQCSETRVHRANPKKSLPVGSYKPVEGDTVVTKIGIRVDLL